MNDAGELMWVVMESSEAGQTTVGVYSTLSKAREVVGVLAGDRLESYRIEAHVLDASREEPTPWHVVVSREGVVEGVTAFVGCNCQDDEAEYQKRSFIEDGGDRMYVMAFALTPGLAADAALQYRTWLRDNAVWDNERVPLQPIMARTPVQASSAPGNS